MNRELDLKLPSSWPTHQELPDEDEAVPRNPYENEQTILLGPIMRRVLDRLHPDGRYFMGMDCYIYWAPRKVPTEGAKAPDWYYVPNVEPDLVAGAPRRSYVLWHEKVPPLAILEYGSHKGEEERDATPETGKYWVYERCIKPRYYGIFLFQTGELEFYERIRSRFRRMLPNRSGRYVIPPLRVQFGLWEGTVAQYTGWWLRAWDLQGRLLPSETELAAKERQEKLAERLEKDRARRLVEQERRDKEEAQRRELEAQQLAEQERHDKEEARRLAEQERRDKEEAQRRELEAQKLAEQERHDKEEARRRELEAQRLAEQERRDRSLAEQRARGLAERLRALGIDPEAQETLPSQ